MRIKGAKVLVTGAGGFIGSHLTEALIQHGCQVRAFVRYNSSGSWGWLEYLDERKKSQLDVFAGDITDPHGCMKAMEGIDVVFHLAALIAIPYSYHSPATYVETNVKGTLNLLEAARRAGVKRFVQTSTSEVYGTAQFVPITEAHPLHGQSPYSATKIGSDQIAISFHRSFDFPVVVARPFNTYGPRQSARAVLPTVITQLLAGAGELKLGAIHPTRDFNFVADTAAGFIALAEADAAVGEVVNISSNFEISVEASIKAIAEVLSVNPVIKLDGDRVRPQRSEVDRLWGDNSKILSLTEWKPQYAGLQGFKKGIGETIEWFRSGHAMKLYKPGRYNI
ncbi:MAG: hypothetical protein RIQ81_608 [Pseudomonadota bacterium]